jgi:hypothetical protein
MRTLKMTMSGSKVQEFILKSIVPICCSIVVGFVFYQWDVFNRHYVTFQFVWSGVVASVFYYLLIYLRPRDALLGFILLLFFTFLTTGSTRAAFILRDIFYSGGIGLSIFIYFKYFRPVAPPMFAYPAFMLAGIYGVVYIIASEIHLGVLRAFLIEEAGGTILGLATSIAFFGVSIGFAVGCGIGLNEKLFAITGKILMAGERRPS